LIECAEKQLEREKCPQGRMLAGIIGRSEYIRMDHEHAKLAGRFEGLEGDIGESSVVANCPEK
jgi:hypothetical protein